LEWVDENKNNCSLDCFFEDERRKEGLFIILKELKLISNDAVSSQYLFPRLIEIAKSHPAFEIDTNLSLLATKYKKISFIFQNFILS
jgi:hypothetical protein